MPSRARHLIAYGTLMSTCSTNLGRAERELMSHHARLLGAASLPGILYDAGACPAIVLVDGRCNRRDRVFGQLWEIVGDSALLLRTLDRYEGCAAGCPQPYPYVRRRASLQTPDGRRVVAWLYEWNRPTVGLSRLVTGRWRPREPLDVTEHVMDCSQALAA